MPWRDRLAQGWNFHDIFQSIYIDKNLDWDLECMPSNDSLIAFHIVIKDLKSAPATPGLASLLRHWGILVRLLRSLSELQCPHLGTGAVFTSLMRSCSSRVLLNKLPPCHSALLLLLSLRSRRECKELRTTGLLETHWHHHSPGMEKVFPLFTTAPRRPFWESAEALSVIER